ncbi:MAG: hypothetical protein ACFFAQ_16595 [Promethearchaeota archaeon]
MQYPRRHKLNLIITFILIIIIPGIVFLVLFSDSIYNELDKSTTSLDYIQYRSYGSSYKYTYYDIKWSFISSNQNIGITVLAMDYMNYQKFLINDSTVHYYLLSNGLKYKDKGIFSVPYNEYWTIVFINLDPDREITSVTLSVETVINPLIFYIIPSIVAFSLIFIFILIYFISKKLKKESYALVPLFFITVSYSYYMMFMIGNII